MSNTLNEVEAGLNIAAAAGTVLGGPVGATVDAALPAAETIVNTVFAEAPHHTALRDIANAVSAAAPVVAAAGTGLSPTAAAQVATGMSALQALVGFLKTLF
jgi:hypothetical protein